MRTTLTHSVWLLLLCMASLSGTLLSQNPCDTILVVAQASATDMTCDNPVATLTGALDPSALTYQWSGPGGFSSSKRVAQNFVKGVYTLTVTGALGCTAQTSVTVSDLCTSYPLIPPACDPPYDMIYPADDCENACVIPFLPPNQIFSTAGYTPSPLGVWSCGTIENDQWIAFIAGATAGSITATALNCINGNGIQLGLYDDCPAYNLLACDGGVMGGADLPVTLNLSNLHIGEVYYLRIDGFAGDECDFTFYTPNNICTAPPYDTILPPVQVTGPTVVCPNAYVDYHVQNLFNTIATATLWTAPVGSTINSMPSPLLIYKPEGETVTVNFGPESGFVCMREIFYFYPPGPPVCFSVDVEPIPPTVFPPATVCNEDLPYILPWGDEVYASGTYQTTLYSWLGCDSIVKQKITVKPPIIKNLGTINRCANDCFEIGGQSYCETGAYTAELQSFQGCDSLVNFSLVMVDPVAEILGGGTLTCTQTSVTLTSTPSQGTRIWKNASGQILSTSAVYNVTQPGLYILTVSQPITGGLFCTKSDTILIAQNLTPPIVTAQGGTLTCTSPAITLTGTSDILAVLKWSGPNGFTAVGASTLVSAPGDYYFIATGPNGCIATALAQVTADQTAPLATAGGGQLTCTNPVASLTGTSSDPLAILSWSGPNGFTASGSDVLVTVPGTYYFTAESANGCSSTATAVVTADQNLPIVSAFGGTLTCTTTMVQLLGTVSNPQTGFIWSGPDGFSSTELNPSVSLPGTYTLTATSAGGCQASAAATVFANQQAPPLSLSADSLDCNPANVAHVYAAPALPNMVYSWNGPNGFVAGAAAPVVSVPGEYTVTVSNPASGCTSVSSIVVSGSLDIPNLLAFQVPPACGDSLLFLEASSTTPDVQYQWTGPDAFLSTSEDLAVGVPGWYIISAATDNGCKASISVLVVAAPTVPQISINGGVLNCVQTMISLQANSNLPVSSYHWSGPAGFLSVQADPDATVPGTYNLTVTATNGCSADKSYELLADLEPPQLSVTGGIITCDQPSVTLTASSGTPGVVFNWLGNFPSNQANVDVNEAGEYTVMATAPNGCTASAVVVVPDSCLTSIPGIYAILRPEFRVYPNASTGIAFAEVLHSDGFEALRVHTSDGRLILQRDFATPKTVERMDLTHWPAGVYLVSVRIESEWRTERLILMD